MAELVGTAIGTCNSKIRGSGGMPPRNIWDFRPTEIVCDAVLGK